MALMTEAVLISQNDPRTVRSRQALHAAMLTLLDEKPFADITIRALAAEAGIGYTTFFRHHPSKESLLEAVAAEQIGVIIDLAVPILGTQDLRAASEAIFTYVDEHRMMWSTLITGGAAGKIREEFLRRARAAAIPLRKATKKVPMDCGIVLIVSGTIELIDWWLRHKKPLPIRRIAEIHDLAVVSPIMQANGFMAGKN
jgi:AcrR family transcriptional regulator